MDMGETVCNAQPGENMVSDHTEDGNASIKVKQGQSFHCLDDNKNSNLCPVRFEFSWLGTYQPGEEQDLPRWVYYNTNYYVVKRVI